MTKPRNDDRIATAIRFDPELHAKLVKAAGERDISVNYLVNAAVKDYVARLIPIEELSLVRQPEPKIVVPPHLNRFSTSDRQPEPNQEVCITKYKLESDD